MTEASDPVTVGGVRPFGDVLAERVAGRESQIVLGLDPDPMALWPEGHRAGAIEGDERRVEGYPRALAGATGRALAGEGETDSPAWRAAGAVLDHCRAVIDAVGPACVAVKPQLACFERLGPTGWWALERVLEHARGIGLIGIADGKRGDIAVTAEAYGQALTGGVQTPFGPVGGLRAELATVNPLMGADAVRPFVAAARRAGSGVLVLLRTSNPGAADVQDLPVRGGGTVWEQIAGLVEELGRERLGRAGIADVGAVMGATRSEHLQRARELMPSAFFLLPGVGAQGGRVEDLAAAFGPGRAGGLVAASRGIVNAYRDKGGSPAGAARAEAERLRGIAWSLG